MKKSNVYFTDFRTGFEPLPKKMMRMLIKAGIGEINFKDKFVAVKIHFGELGNLGYIRHQYAKAVCDYIKEQGGWPFLTDANTLYVGSRNNAVSHLECAFTNGFNPLSTGVQTIIADGLRGTDEREIPVKDAKHCPVAKIGAAIAEADIIISMSHCKGHQAAGYGGTLKNLGMGCGSKKGKMEMHSASTPEINKDACKGCGMCVKNCNNNGVEIVDGKAKIDEDKCLGCGYCFSYCPHGAIMCKWDEANAVLNEKIAEYSKAVVDGKPAFHINFVQNVSPHCDCKPANDVGMIPDVGIFASYDPVALDQACMDAINSSPLIEHSCIADAAESHGEHAENGIFPANDKHDVFKMVHPETCWQAGLTHAENLGLGTRNYELIEL